MSEEKVYTPEVIAENPYPVEVSEASTSSQKDTGGVYTPSTTKDKPLPKKIIARETVSSSLNTLSRKILAVYEFAKMGAILIGEYIAGVSGEVRISPDGIVAKNKDGETTFALDGQGGNASFKGTLKAGSLIAGDDDVVIEKGTNGGRIVIYNDGLPSVVIGDPT